MRHTTIAGTTTNKKEAEYYISKGACLFDIRNGRYYFDSEDIRSLRLEWHVIYEKRGII